MGTLSNAGLTRRSIVLNAAGAGLAAALDLPARANPMSWSNAPGGGAHK